MEACVILLGCAKVASWRDVVFEDVSYDSYLDTHQI